MRFMTDHSLPIPLLLSLVLGPAGCAPGASDLKDAAPAPLDFVAASSQISRDTPPSGVANPAPRTKASTGPQVSPLEYEGWRLYSVNCARCHGQDALPNPVAASLLISLAPGGAVETSERFAQVVSAGRPSKGMPPFKEVLTPHQIEAVYAYLKGRAGKRIPPGRPAKPAD